MARLMIGITQSASGFNNCHRHFPELIEAVKRGVLAAGGLPLDFPTISLGEVFSLPTLSEDDIMRIVVHGQQAFGKSVLDALLERGENVVGRRPRSPVASRSISRDPFATSQRCGRNSRDSRRISA